MLSFNEYCKANHVRLLDYFEKYQCWLLVQPYEYKLLTPIYVISCWIINSEGTCFHNCLKSMLNTFSKNGNTPGVMHGSFAHISITNFIQYMYNKCDHENSVSFYSYID